MKKEERQWYAKVVEDGCFICGMPAEVHHKTGSGLALKSHYKDSMPLCPEHHRLSSFGHAVHNGTKTFEKNYFTQDYMIEETRKRIESD